MTASETNELAITLTAGNVEVSEGVRDTHRGVKLGIDDEPFWRVWLTPQGEILTGNGLSPPTTYGGGGGGGDVATDAIWDAVGDLVVGTGPNTAARFAIGANGDLLQSDGTTVTWNSDIAGDLSDLMLSAIFKAAPGAGLTAVSNLFVLSQAEYDALLLPGDDTLHIIPDTQRMYVGAVLIASATASGTAGGVLSGSYPNPGYAAGSHAYTTAEQTKVGHLSVTQAVDLDAIETRVNDLDAAVVLRGTWDASAGTFPGGGTAQAGSSYIVSVGGTVNSIVFTANDRIVAIVDNASTTTYAANWHKLDYTDAVLSVDGATGAVSLSSTYQPLDADLTALAAANNSGVLAATTASFLTADESKLDGIEAAADVTDATNVNAAGAVMESDYNALTMLHATSDDTPVPVSVTAAGLALLDDADASAQRTTLGLGTAATQASTAFDAAGSAAAAQAASQPLDADLTDIAAIADAQGDIIIRGAAGWQRLAKSATSTDVLTAGASQPEWAAVSGGSGLTHPQVMARVSLGI